MDNLYEINSYKTFPRKYDDFEIGISSWNHSHFSEYNLFVDSDPTFFEEFINCNEWKNAMQREYDALTQMVLGSWWILLLTSNPVVESRFIKLSIKLMVHLTSTRQGLWQRVMKKRKVFITHKCLIYS